MHNFAHAFCLILFAAVVSACNGTGNNGINNTGSNAYSGVVITSSQTPNVQLAFLGRPNEWAVPDNAVWFGNIISITTGGVAATAVKLNTTSYIAVRHQEPGVVATLGVSVPIVLDEITFVSIAFDNNPIPFVSPLSLATVLINALPPEQGYTAVTTDYQSYLALFSATATYTVRRIAPDTALSAALDRNDRLIITCSPDSGDYCFGWRYTGNDRKMALMLGDYRLDLLRLPTNIGGYANTYRLGFSPYQSDTTSLYFGIDSHNNTIFTARHKTHSFGIAKQNKQYAAKYEYRFQIE